MGFSILYIMNWTVVITLPDGVSRFLEILDLTTISTQRDPWDPGNKMMAMSFGRATCLSQQTGNKNKNKNKSGLNQPNTVTYAVFAHLQYFHTLR